MPRRPFIGLDVTTEQPAASLRITLHVDDGSWSASRTGCAGEICAPSPPEEVAARVVQSLAHVCDG